MDARAIAAAQRALDRVGEVAGRLEQLRAAALLRLNSTGAARLLPYVRDACGDPSQAVREAAFVALARARDLESLERAAVAMRDQAEAVTGAIVLIHLLEECAAVGALRRHPAYVALGLELHG